MEILGLLDTLESMILEGFRIPMTKKTVINEEKVLQVMDKIRLVVQGGGKIPGNTITTTRPPVRPKQETIEGAIARGDVEKVKQGLSNIPSRDDQATELIENAYKIAKEVRMGADKYADEVLSNLEATSSRILRAVKAGRSRLGRFISSPSGQETRLEEDK